MEDGMKRHGQVSPHPAEAERDGQVSAHAAEVELLYRALSGRLEQLVRLDVRAPDPVIEDACQVAWSRLVVHLRRIRREAALSWLARTAVREAVKLTRREGRELSLDAELDWCGHDLAEPSSGGPHELLEQRERLGSIRALPERQQRLMWLQGVGFNYAEMATRTGCTPRTVERQLLRAKQRMRLLAAGEEGIVA
jgi:RNA polymerase sigma factor (sigma-70 family)